MVFYVRPVGDKVAYSGGVDEPTFNMVYVPGGISFPTGYNDDGIAMVANAYEIGETEVTYELWYTVRAWAELPGNGYTFFNNPGREGSSGSIESTAPSANKQEPVTMVTWFDTVVWLNALTEWYNVKNPGSNLTPVYYYDTDFTDPAKVAKNSTSPGSFEKENVGYTYASAYAKPGATGFRLPSSNEWELAARWQGTTGNSNSVTRVSGTTTYYFTKGDSASGATGGYGDNAWTQAVAWYLNSSDFPSGIQKTQPVKGKDANDLELYDMSGNVWEWCEDWYPHYQYIGSYRFVRGGSWGHDASNLTVGYDFSVSSPDFRYYTSGLRPARTAN
jgi:formylglycine-generating enzyme required for sulfatase activity